MGFASNTMSSRIEFCGVPGSGKSTASASAIQCLRDQGHKVLSRSDMAGRQLRRRDFGLIANTIATLVPGWRQSVLSLPHGMQDWIRFTSRLPGFVNLIHGWLAEPWMTEAWRTCTFHAVATTAFEFELAATEDRPVLLDEGFAQRFFSLRGYAGVGTAADAARYAEFMPLPSALVVMTTAPDICLPRLKSRPELPLLMQHEPDAMLLNRLAEGSALLVHLAQALQKRGLPVLLISGNDGAPSAGATIADFAKAVL
jgi:hypothetical protein